MVASNPKKVILAALLGIALGSLGLLNFTSEGDGWSFWLPEGSRHQKVTDWLEENLPEDTRATITLFSHERDVLTPEGLLLLLDLHQKVREVQFQGKNYTHFCLRIPVTNIGLASKKRRRRNPIETEVTSRPFEMSTISLENLSYDYDSHNNLDYFNFYGLEETEETEGNENNVNSSYGDEKLDNLPKDIYCDIVETLEDKCGEFSILEIWKYDRNIISSLTKLDILNAINAVAESPIFGYKTNYIDYLGQVEFNSTGHAVKAKTIRSIWLEHFDPNKIPSSQELVGFEFMQVDRDTQGYEEEVLKIIDKRRTDRVNEDRGFSLYMNLGLSYSTETNKPINNDSLRQIMGYSLMFVYTFISLGKFNMLENKFFLAAAGIGSIFFGITVGLGLTMVLGLPYTPLSGIVPFISLAIGIDDMFVIMRCFSNIPDVEKKKNGHIKNMGLTMKHAGAAITVTSLTDICAFMTGALTYFPSLQSFCVSTAFAILAIYLLQISWFLAFMVLDQHRIEEQGRLRLL